MCRAFRRSTRIGCSDERRWLMSRPERTRLEKLKEAFRESVREGVSNFLPQVTAELKQQWAHGAHELAAALFNGSAFVMYPRNPGQRVEDPQHAPPEAQQEQERSGMER